PMFWEAELAHVIWLNIRAAVITPEEGISRLDLASELGVRMVPTRDLWHGALARSVASGVAVYDTLFVELAAREALPLPTFDKKILAAFPKIARRPGALAPN